jgi:hypothetical protein
MLLGAWVPSLRAQTQQEVPSKPSTPTIEYRNKQYGFCFALPESWKGYSIVMDEWSGFNNSGPQGYQVVEHGPLISIRHPLWTKENPRQDIPIMVFTRAQWDSLEKDDFHIGAAPIGPSELGRNRTYVFALPARYNFAFPTGFEEVDQIIQSKPLHGPCKKH